MEVQVGEKGNVPDVAGAIVAAASDPSVIEKVTTTTTHTVLGVGEDVLTKVRDKAVDHGADALIDGARSRAKRATDDPRRSPEDEAGIDEATGERDG